MEYKNQSLQVQVYGTIKKRLLDQTYVNGQMLSERTLAAELQISRTPVRRAIQQLQKEGWVQYIPKRGILVKGLSMQDLKNIFQIRTALEILAVRLACEHIKADQLDVLRLTVQQQLYKYQQARSAPDYQEFIRSDSEFHNTIILSSGNLMLRRLVGELRDKITRTGINSLYSRRSRCAEAAEEHWRIVQALEARDAKAACEAMDSHLGICYITAHDYILRHTPTLAADSLNPEQPDMFPEDADQPLQEAGHGH